jgi:hypothetical protein
MKIRFAIGSITIFLFIFISKISIAQTVEEKRSVLGGIIDKYEQINAYKAYKTITIDDAEEIFGHATDNGASLTGYFKADTLKKIILWVGLSNKTIQDEFYFERGLLIFVFTTEREYLHDNEGQDSGVVKLEKGFHERYYFSQGKLFHAILSDKEHVDAKERDAQEFLEANKDYGKLLT